MFDRRDIMVSVKNASEDMPVEFSINKVANFFAAPSRGRLMPGQSQNIIVTFKPSQMGRFQNVLHFVLAGNTLTVPLRLQGRCSTSAKKSAAKGGPSSMPEDFKPSYNFVTPVDGVAAVPPSPPPITSTRSIASALQRAGWTSGS